MNLRPPMLAHSQPSVTWSRICVDDLLACTPHHSLIRAALHRRRKLIFAVILRFLVWVTPLNFHMGHNGNVLGEIDCEPVIR